MKRLYYYLVAIAWTAFAIAVDKLSWKLSDLEIWTRDKADEAEDRYRRGGK